MSERELFIAALQIDDESERSAFLDQSCAGNPELKKRIEALLHAHFETDHRLERPLVDPEAVDSASGGPATEATGVHTPQPDGNPNPSTVTVELVSDAKPNFLIAGRYTLQEKIGEGGMGEVWVAKQSEPVKRKVALKLIKQGMDSRAVLQRFEQERQALAMMDHPNIAKVLDAGLTPSGQPFFAMELVNGLPLNKFCDELKLTPKDRLELFVPICQAVQHAHQKGIVHRDLKPANILITTVDAKPVPKVIDFGVAKATSGKLTDESMNTQFGAVVGTLEYMSPEQAGFASEDVDTRADIYSLGVILYELLTGLRPIDAARLKKAALTEMIRIIHEEEPSKPSTRLSTDASLPSMAAMRQTDPRKLMTMLRGELDWVVMKCLEKHRERRYETANALARDVQRYLDDEAVEARPPSAGYRFGKFLKRHKAAVTAASLVLLVLLGGIAGTTYGLFRAQAAQKAEAKQRAVAVQERDKAIAAQRQTAFERDKALAAEAKTKTINDFLTQDLLTQAEPANNAVEDKVTLLEVLDRAAEKVGTRFAGQPELEQTLRRTMMTTYHGLASWEKAEAQARALLDESRKQNPLSSEAYQAQSELAHMLHHRGRRDAEVLEMAETAAKGMERSLNPNDLGTLTALDHLATIYRDAGRLPEAIALYERVRDASVARFGPDHPNTLATLGNLATAFDDAGRTPEAIALFERVRDAQTSTLGPDHPNTLTTLSNLAGAYKHIDRTLDAIALFERVRNAQVVQLGPDHPSTLITLNNLGLAYQASGKRAEAIAVFERVRDPMIAKLGPDHPNTLIMLSNLALAYKNVDRFPEAIALYERARDGQIAKLGLDHPDTLSTLNKLAVAYWCTKQFDKSVPLFEDVLKRSEAILGRQHPDTQMILANLATNYRDAGRFPEAIPVLERLRDSRIATLGPDHPATLSALHDLASAYPFADRVPEAISLFERVRDRQIAKLGPDHPDTLNTLSNLAPMYWRTKQFEKSVPLFEDLLERREAKLGRQDFETQRAVANLGVNYKDAGRFKEAIPLLEEAHQAAKRFPALGFTGPQLIDAYAMAGENAKLADLLQEQLPEARKALPNDSPELAGLLAPLGMSLLQQKKWTEAEPLLRECLVIRERAQPDVWSTFNTKSLLGGVFLGQNKYAEAEPLLLAGYEGMKQREAAIPAHGKVRLVEALERLVQFYEATNKPDDAAKWRKELEDRKAAVHQQEKKP
jgi:eukaryotic-like serine/threonine-protein kinase